MADPKRAAAKRSASRGKTKKKRRSPWLRVLGWTGLGLAVLALLGITAVVIAYGTVKIPDQNADFKTNTTFVYYNDGKTQLGSFQVQNRVSVNYDDMNQYAKDAIVAAENQTFWTDPGFDPSALARAVVSVFGP
ncbi:MAG: transglycosylase domain-containing protein, partial [Propionicimonas sp.]|nr:transglycosylase domain-containing protein [Propionicimonas sp.]